MLVWKDITLRLRDTRFLLDNVSGTTQPGQLNALLGPSGAGKTSLVKVLAKRLVRQKDLLLTGSVRLNDQMATRSQIGFVEQENFFFPTLSVLETVAFIVNLHFGENKTREEKNKLTWELLLQLKLEDASSTRVGNHRIKGISGGEKKRLAIAVELVDETKPCLILDEPTTGLDSAQALKVIEILSMMKTEKIVLFTIHQPRSSIVELLDHVFFLVKGQIVYRGPGSGVAAYLHDLGFECPLHFNPFDFFLDVISDPNRENCEMLYRQDRERTNMTSSPQPFVIVDDSSSPTRNIQRGWWSPIVSFHWVFRRSFQQMCRNSTAITIRVVLNLLLSLLIGSFYAQDSPYSYQKIQNKTGVLYLTTTNQAFGSVFNTINLFVSEKGIVLPEIENGRYGPLAYFLGRWLSDLPFTLLGPVVFGVADYFMVHLRNDVCAFFRYLLAISLASTTASSMAIIASALVSTPEIASAVITPFNIIFFIFAGVFISLQNLPSALRWISKISYIKWCFEALMVNEFREQTFHCLPEEGPMCVPSGDQVLESYGFHTSYRDAVLCLAGLNAGFLFLGYAAFLFAQRRFF